MSTSERQNAQKRAGGQFAKYLAAWEIMKKMDDKPGKTDETELGRALGLLTATWLVKLEKDVNTEIQNEGVPREDRLENPGAGWSVEARKEGLPEELLKILAAEKAKKGGGKRRSKKRRTKKRRTKKRRTKKRRTRTRRR